jgi:hypothetical protein
MTYRTSTVDLATAMGILSEQIQSGDGVANAAISQAGYRLLELRRLLEQSLPAVELFADDKTFQAIRVELGI